MNIFYIIFAWGGTQYYMIDCVRFSTTCYVEVINADLLFFVTTFKRDIKCDGDATHGDVPILIVDAKG